MSQRAHLFIYKVELPFRDYKVSLIEITLEVFVFAELLFRGLFSGGEKKENFQTEYVSATCVLTPHSFINIAGLVNVVVVVVTYGCVKAANIWGGRD